MAQTRIHPVGKAPPSGKGLRILRKESVLEMARRRMKWIFDEFEGKVMVNVSGGKDSQVMYDLALEAAEAGGYLPLAVYWLDQEAEWQSTVDLIELWMSDPRVEPWWLQCPFRIFNATSHNEHWLNAWEPGVVHVHDQHPMSIKINDFGTDRFYELFEAVAERKFGRGTKCVTMSGVRAEEARVRFMGTTMTTVYKWVTWGLRGPNDWPDYKVLYPLYDWSTYDVWKWIHESGRPYNAIYDHMWQRGLHPFDMRVSNLHHEHAVRELFILQEVEPETYDRLVARVDGVHMAATLGTAYFPKKVPFMFESWREYRDYLLEHLIDEEHQPYLRHMFALMDRRTPPEWFPFIHKAHCRTIMLNDVEGKSLGHTASYRVLRQAQKDYVKDRVLEPLGPAPPKPRMPYS